MPRLDGYQQTTRPTETVRTDIAPPPLSSSRRTCSAPSRSKQGLLLLQPCSTRRESCEQVSREQASRAPKSHQKRTGKEGDPCGADSGAQTRIHRQLSLVDRAVTMAPAD